jgi:hypothetical protein
VLQINEISKIQFFQLAKASQAGSGFLAKKVEHLVFTASQAMVLNFIG